MSYVYIDTLMNESIGMDASQEYFLGVIRQYGDCKVVLGNITDANMLGSNLRTNCIPPSVVNMTVRPPVILREEVQANGVGDVGLPQVVVKAPYRIIEDVDIQKENHSKQMSIMNPDRYHKNQKKLPMVPVIVTLYQVGNITIHIGATPVDAS